LLQTVAPGLLSEEVSSVPSQLTLVTHPDYLNVHGFAILTRSSIAPPRPNTFLFNNLQFSTDWFGSCFHDVAAAVSREIGEKMNHTVNTAVGRNRKRTMLPLLVFLFVISYGLLTMLVVLQDRTIDAQSDLIHLLFKESRRLHVVAAAQKNQISVAKQRGSQNNSHTQLPSSQVPKIQAPSSQVPMSQSATQIPSSQEKRPATAKAGKNQHKADRRSPFRPPAEMTDPSDMRRTLFSI
jgi:hypothetical protein